VYIDVAGLRSTGILDAVAGSRAAESEEYRKFVQETRFDYRTDLDAVLIAYRDGNGYYLVRGRFDWKSIRGYGSARGGCYNAYCLVQGSIPERMVSYMPLRSGVLAIAVGKDPALVKQMADTHDNHGLAQLPDQPVWISVPAEMLRKPETFPSGTQQFVKALQRAGNAVISISPESERFAARLEVECNTPEDAVVLRAQLEYITETLRKYIERTGQKPNIRDLSGVLTRGTFQRVGRKVFGHWPIERAFIETVAGGPI
jgi:hypothetical protein